MKVLDTIGTGYTEAVILEFITDDNSKFIGYIPTKKEYIIATVFADNAYGWTTYGKSIKEVIASYEYKSNQFNKDYYVEKLDSALSDAVDHLEDYRDEESIEEIIDLSEEIRGIIND